MDSGVSRFNNAIRERPTGSVAVLRYVYSSFPLSLPDPFVQRPLQSILYRVRADRIPYIGQPQGLLDDEDHLSQVEQLEDINDIVSEPEEKRVEEEIKPARIRKCKYKDLS